MAHAHSAGHLVQQGLPLFYSCGAHLTYKYPHYVKAMCLPPGAVTKRLPLGLLLPDQSST